MSQDRVRYELKLLGRACESVRDQVERLRTASRYAKTPDRIAAFVEKVQAARERLEGVFEDESASADKAEVPPVGGWLKRRLNKMTRSLVASDDSSVEEASEDEGIAASGFHGDSFAIALPGLLSFLENQDKSGMLQIRLPAEEVTLEFDRGALVLAISNSTPEDERLGALLVKAGAITKQRLESFLACFRSSSRRLGDALIQGELVEAPVLYAALHEQAQLLFTRLLSAADVSYTFREGRPETSPGGPRLTITRLLLESARSNDELNRPEEEEEEAA